jgi:hypothetical protein
MIRTTRGRRRAVLAGVLAAAAVTVPVLAISSSTFDSSDGNLTTTDVASFGTNDNDAQDWINAPNRVSGVEQGSGSSDDSFGNGTKEDTPVPSLVTGGIPPNKSDLLRFYVANETVGSRPLLYLAWVRSNTLGSANMDFELNHTRTLSSNGKTPVRTSDDVLVTFDFSNGGDHVDINLLKWKTSGANSLCEAGGGTTADGCWGAKVDLDASGFADGAVNDGFSTTDPIAGGTIVANGFGETGIDLIGALGLPADGCESFGSVYLKSRSSDSFTAASKDFVPPANVDISLCRPARIKAIKKNSAGTTLGGASFELYEDVNGDGVLQTTGLTPDRLLRSCGPTTVNGECQMADLNKNDVTTVNNAVKLILHESVAPPGYSVAPDQAFTVTFGTSIVTVERIFVDAPTPGKIRVDKVDDDSPANPVAGATFVLYNDVDNSNTFNAGDTNTGKSCVATATVGSCEFTGLAPGEYVAVETVAPTGYDLPTLAADRQRAFTIAVAAGGDNSQSITFTDPRKFKVITIVCRESSPNTMYPSSVTFDGSLKTSAAAADLPAGVTAAQACAIGGASYPGKHYGQITGGIVDIPR